MRSRAANYECWIVASNFAERTIELGQLLIRAKARVARGKWAKMEDLRGFVLNKLRSTLQCRDCWLSKGATGLLAFISS